MKKIALSQRVDFFGTERRDSLDQRWYTFFKNFDVVPLPIPNIGKDVRAWLSDTTVEGVVLTGGNDLSSLPHAENPAPERDETERLVLEYCHENNLPVVGVCRGCQFLLNSLGFELKKFPAHCKTTHTLNSNTNKLPKVVNSFHTWGVSRQDVGEGITVMAYADDGCIECFSAEQLQYLGMMWHPERDVPIQNLSLEQFKLHLRL